MRTLRTIIFLFLLPATALAQDKTTRQAYLEGWFQETAEANLAQAIKHYREAVERNTDEELVARSLWRMGVIARAQDEEQIAQAMFEQVVERYPDSRAAVLAAEAAKKTEQGSAQGPESEAVTQALELLRSLLMGPEPNRVPEQQVRLILDSLSASQILAESRRLKADAYLLVQAVRGDIAREHADELFEFAAKGTDAEASEATRVLLQWVPGELDPRMDGLLEREDLSKDLVLYLAEYFHRFDERRLDFLHRLLLRWPHLRVGVDGGWPSLADRPAPGIDVLLATGTESALEVLKLFLEPVLDQQETYEGLATRVVKRPSVLGEDTPVRQWILEWLPRCRAATRVQVAAKAGEPYGQADAPVLQWMLGDPEPQVRHHGILHLLHANAEAEPILDFIALQPAGSRRNLAVMAATMKDGPCDPEQVLGRMDSRNREYLYWHLCLGGSSRELRVMDVVRTGLRREDPELLTALFSPQYWQDWTNGWSPASQALVGAWKRGDVRFEDRQVLVDLLERAASHPLQRVTNQAIEVVRGIELPASDLVTFRALVLGSADTSVRRMAIGLLPWTDFTHEQKVALLLDPSLQLAKQARNACTDSAVLSEAIPRMDLVRLQFLFSQKVLIERLSPGVRRVLMLQVPPDHRIWQDCFLLLHEHDADVLLEGLTHPATGIHGASFRVLAGIGAELPAGERGAGYRQELVRTLESQREDVQRRLVERRIRILEDQCRRDSREGLNAAQELVSLGARDALRRAARGLSYSHIVDGLADLGDKEGLREILFTTPDTGRWILDAALRVGLFEDVLAMAQQERIQGTDLGMSLRILQMVAESRLILRDHPDLAARVGNNEQLVLDSLTEQDDPVLLARLTDLWGQEKPLLLLIQQRAWDALFQEAHRWPQGPQTILCREMHRLLGAPGTEAPQWPQYHEDQQALIASWRAALKEKGLDD